MTIMAPLGLLLGGHYTRLRKKNGDEDVGAVPSGEGRRLSERDITFSHPATPDVMTDKQPFRSSESAS